MKNYFLILVALGVAVMFCLVPARAQDSQNPSQEVVSAPSDTNATDTSTSNSTVDSPITNTTSDTGNASDASGT